MQAKVLSSIKSPTIVSEIAIIISASLLLGLCANISIPFYPVPLTLQTFAVLLIGGLLGPKRAALTVAAYIAEGAGGLPFFSAGNHSLAYLMGPTGGYIIGFFPLAIIMGYFSEHYFKKPALWLLAVGALSGMLCTYALGISWLSTFTGWTNAVNLGVMPFILGDLLKISVACAILMTIPRLHTQK